jgi:sulfoxide reductase heme-binding subunit YedZ
MMLAAGPSTTWYLTRSAGAVSLLLLTGAVALGVVEVRRWSSARWPRFAIDSLHRNVALLAVCFLAVHILTSVLDGFTSIGLSNALIPFTGSYRPFWLGLGALAFDLLLAVAFTSLLRQRLGYARWRAVHWLAYASWPIALMHGLGTGTDAKTAWMQVLVASCFLAVVAAVAARVLGSWNSYPDRGRVTIGAVAVFTLFLALWLPSGPLGSEWARRSGTPSSLLAHTHGLKQGDAKHK